MSDTFDAISQLPVADIRIGKKQYLRIYGDPELTPPLIEWRLYRYGQQEYLPLTFEQAENIAAALLKAVAKATGGK